VSAHDLMSRLKAATAPMHARLEAALPFMHADLTLDAYAALLARFLTFVAPWEDALARQLGARHAALVSPRRKAHLLRDDLAAVQALGARSTPSGEAAAPPALDSDAAVFGAMYVMEGSTLGGRFIAPCMAERFGLADGRGCRYFDPYGAHTGSMWNAFRQAAVAAVPPHQHDEAARAAVATFTTLHGVLAGETMRVGA
jgi:heme oxygenase